MPVPPPRQTSRCVCLLFLAAAVPAGLAAPPAGGGWVSYEPLTDEFDGATLDQSKWFDHNPDWRGREPVFFHADCVAVADGRLSLSALPQADSSRRRPPKGFTHVSGYVRGKTPIRFGYFEMRARLMDSSLVSCFWLSEHRRAEWSEIDIVECPAGVDAHRGVIPTNTHYFHGPQFTGTRDRHPVDPERVAIDFDPTADFHTYGLEWTATHLRWFIDDRMVREAPNRWCFQPLRMSINVEANGYFQALPDDTRLPAAYEIDWVRTWRPAGAALE